MNLFPFTPSIQQNQTFNPTLGTNTYTAVVTWNLFGQRWYLNLYDGNGTLIISTAVVASQDPQSLVSVTWADNVVSVVTESPHWLPIGSTAMLYLSGNVPDAYNGLVLCDITGPNSFSFDLTTNPGAATTVGAFGSVIDLSAGAVDGAMLLFLAGTQQFATTP